MRAILVLALAWGVSSAAEAGGDAAAGAEKAKRACAACHGEDGNTPREPDYPKLGGQHYDYLLQALRAYKSGARKNSTMGAQVQALSAKEMKDLAAYYAGQKSTLFVIPLHRLARQER